MKDILIIDLIMVGLILLSFAVLAILKLCGVLAWEWSCVFVPLQILGVWGIFHLIILIALLVIAFLAEISS